MAIVQTAYGENTGTNAVATFGTAVTSGNAVLLAFFLSDYASSDPGGTGSGLSGASDSPPDVLFDDQGNSYTQLQVRAPLDSPLYNPSGGVYFYARANITNGPTVFTLHDSSFRFTLIQAVELSGRDNALVVGINTTPAQFTTTTSPSAGFTTSTADEDVIAVFIWDGLGTATTFTAGSGWTKASPSASSTYAIEVRNCATATSYNADGTLGVNESGDIVALSLRAAATGNTVTPGAGALTLGGLTPSLIRGTVAYPGSGTLAFGGLAPTVVQGRTVSPGVGLLALAGLAPSLIQGTVAYPGAGALTLAGLAPSILQGLFVSPGAGALALTGLAPALAVSDNQTAAPSAGVLALVGLTPTISVTDAHTATPGAGALSLTGLTPTISATDAHTAAPGVGALALAGLNPTVTTTAAGSVNPGAGVLALTGLTPTISTTDAHSVTPSAGALSFEGLAPSIRVDQTVAPGAADLQLVGYGPQIVVTDAHSVSPGTGALGLTGLTPSIAIGGSFTVYPGAGSLGLEGLEPTVSSGPIESVLSAKFLAKHKNVKFRPLKQESKEPLPADITNMPDAPAPMPNVAAKLARGVLSTLEEVKPPQEPPLKAPQVPIIDIVKAAVAKPAISAVEPVVALPDPVSQTKTEMLAAVEAAVSQLETESRKNAEAIQAALKAENEITRQLLKDMQAEFAKVHAQHAAKTEAENQAAALRATNQKRAKEITQRLLGS